MVLGSFVCQYLWGYYLYQQEYSCAKVRICLTTRISFHSIQYRLPENGRYFITNTKSSKKKGAQTLFNMHVAFVKADGHFNNTHDPAANYMFKVNYKNTRARCEICSKLTLKAQERCQVSLLLTLKIFHTLF